MDLKKKPLGKRAVIGICCGAIVGTICVLAVAIAAVFALHSQNLRDNLCVEFGDSDFYVAAAACDDSQNAVLLLAERSHAASWTTDDITTQAAKLRSRNLDCSVVAQGQTYQYQDTVFYTDVQVIDGHKICYYGMCLPDFSGTQAVLQLGKQQLNITFAQVDDRQTVQLPKDLGSANVQTARAGTGFAAVSIRLTPAGSNDLLWPQVDTCQYTDADNGSGDCVVIPVKSTEDSFFALCGIDQGALPTQDEFISLKKIQLDSLSVTVNFDSPIQANLANVADKDNTPQVLSDELQLVCDSRVRKSNILSAILQRECVYGEIQGANACLLPPGTVPSAAQMEQMFTGVTINGQIATTTPYGQLHLYGVQVLCKAPCEITLK